MTTQPYREATGHDRACDGCGHPMIGIMKCSDLNGKKAPRTHCVDCEEQKKEQTS